MFNALFLNKLASCIYLLTICVVLWPVIAIILLSSAPISAVDVANPDLKLWPAYFVLSNPAKSAYFWIVKATVLSDILNTLPFLILACVIHSFKDITGQ